MIRPDLGDFGTFGEAQNPELWEGCIFSSTPALGMTGAMLPDHSRSGLYLGTTTPVWSTVNGMVGVKSGSYSDNNLKLSGLEYITMCATVQLINDNAMLLETSVDANSNSGSFYICHQSNLFTILLKSPDYNISAISLDLLGLSNEVRSICIVIKGKVTNNELCVKLFAIDGVNYTDYLFFGFGFNNPTTGFADYPLFIGARNKTSVLMSGSIFDVSIHNRPFSFDEALRYMRNPLERYQRRRLPDPKVWQFNSALARNSNILIPGIASC